MLEACLLRSHSGLMDLAAAAAAAASYYTLFWLVSRQKLRQEYQGTPGQAQASYSPQKNCEHRRGSSGIGDGGISKIAFITFPSPAALDPILESREHHQYDSQELNTNQADHLPAERPTLCDLLAAGHPMASWCPVW